MKKLMILIVVNLLITAAHAQKKSQVKLYCDKKQSTITYSMKHPLHSWTGESKEVTAIILTDKKREVIYQVAVAVKISSFDSKNANRDSHAMEVTEALKYPNVTFTSKSIKQVDDKLIVTGTLTFHGVSQLISFEVKKKQVHNQTEVTGGFDVKMTRFKIKPPSLLGMATDDDIKITFRIIF